MFEGKSSTTTCRKIHVINSNAYQYIRPVDIGGGQGGNAPQ